MKIVHISRNRYNAIVRQGYGVRVYEEPRTFPKGDVEYHLLDGERAFCGTCGSEFVSVAVSTPADMESLKYA